jgi:hypothetical protein
VRPQLVLPSLLADNKESRRLPRFFVGPRPTPSLIPSDQSLALQRYALTAAGCDSIYTDTVSGSVTEVLSVAGGPIYPHHLRVHPC